MSPSSPEPSNATLPAKAPRDDAAKLEISWPDLVAVAEHQRLKEVLRSQLFGSDKQPVKIGRFEVRRQVGSGGMGVVYAAHDDELDREVAIKLLLSSTSSEGQGQARLLREAQAMAKLSHPNVAQVYEVGRHDDRVFLAMELVSGDTLRSWRGNAEPSWREILAIYVQAGRGLAAAHRRDIVHRDFKPDNALIGEDGRVRVVDFGLAHGHGRDPAGAKTTALVDVSKNDLLSNPITRTSAFLGTIAYMSPEQFAGTATDARSDQFSFCVSLHEALYGKRPFAGGDAATVAENVIAGRIAPTPSGAKIPLWIRRALLRGLAVDPAERFPTMDALLAVLDRAGRKRRLGAVAAAMLVVGAGAGLAVGIPLASRDRDALCTAAEGELAAVWNGSVARRLAREFSKSGLPYATAMWTRVEDDLNAYSDSWTAARKSACEATLIHRARSQELYDLQMACLDRRRLQLEALIAELANPDARAIEHAAQASSALPPIGPCNNTELLRLGIRPPPNEATATRARELRQRVARATALRRSGKLHESLTVAEAAAEDARAIAYPPVLAEALLELGTVRDELGEGERALETLLQAIDTAEAHRHDEIAARGWYRMITVAALRLKSAPRGHEWFRRARAALQRLGRDSRAYESLWAATLDRLGLVFQAERSFAKAQAQHRKALEIRTRVHGPDHLAVAESLDNLASALAASGSHRDEALRLHERALTSNQRALGHDHPEVARIAFNMAMLHRDMGHYDKARASYEHALAGYRRSYGDDNTRTAAVRLLLAQLDELQGRYDDAIERLSRARPTLERTLPPAHGDRILLYDLLALVRFRQERYDQALEHYRQVLAILQGGDARPLNVAMARGNVAETLAALGRAREAIAQFDEIYRVIVDIVGEDHEYAAFPLKGIGLARLALGEHQRATAALEKSLAIRMKNPGNKPELAETRWALARALARGGQMARARALAALALEFYQSLGPSGSAKAEELERWLKR